MTVRQANFLLMGVIACRSSSYLFSKIGLATLAPWNLLGIRFTLAFILLCLIFHRRLAAITVPTLKAACALGLSMFCCMSCETVSLQTIDSSMASFLENTAVLWVLLLDCVYHRHLPNKTVSLATLTIMAGIFLLTMQGSVPSFSLGAFICLCGSFCYAIWIFQTSKYAHSQDPLLIGILQMGVMGILGLVTAAGLDELAVPQDHSAWLSLAGLILLCSVLGFTFQPIAQKVTGPEKAGLYAALNPFIAAILGWSILGENLGLSQIIGGALIISAILAVNKIGQKKTKPNVRYADSSINLGRQ